MTDSDALLFKKAKGHEAKLAYLGHVLIENRHGLVVTTRFTRVTGRAGVGGRVGNGESDSRPPAGDARCRQALRRKERTALDLRTTRHSGYAVSQRCHKRLEEVFGWLKTVGLLRQTRHRGRDRVGWICTFAVAVYNLVRLRTLRAAAA
ncbi:MAG TPA: hypothetical protein VKW76_01090 [Candidatus Binatia bacterium]|nr:hypothetical protein [Candidatus Binatia bacterium]